MKISDQLIRSIFAFAVVSALFTTVLLELPAIVFADTSSNSISASVVVNTVCTTELSNTLITFPSLQPGGYANTANVVTITNSGNKAANTLVEGTDWTYSSYDFDVSNTLWSATSGGNIGTQLTPAPTLTDTAIVVNAGSSNQIYFGVNVPVGQAPGTYSSTITIELSC